jgi:hypothetical protein
MGNGLWGCGTRDFIIQTCFGDCGSIWPERLEWELWRCRVLGGKSSWIRLGGCRGLPIEDRMEKD